MAAVSPSDLKPPGTCLNGTIDLKFDARTELAYCARMDINEVRTVKTGTHAQFSTEVGLEAKIAVAIIPTAEQQTINTKERRRVAGASCGS